jgi:hypothetical protein
MDSLQYWWLCDELTVDQAAWLMAGQDPLAPTDGALDHNAVVVALSAALKGGSISGTIVPMMEETEVEFRESWMPLDEIEGSVDPKKSVVVVASLREWLEARGSTSGFFHPHGPKAPARPHQPDYLDPSHVRYSSKLAAAIAVWLATSADPRSGVGTSVKKRMVIWLNEHADDFGLRKPDGKLNSDAIEEIAKIANWAPMGGAPKTLSG